MSLPVAVLQRVAGSNDEFELRVSFLLSGNEYVPKGSPLFVHVPAGFHTDLASIPPALRCFIKTWGLHLEAAIWHDYRYREGIGKRKEADQDFYNLMKLYGVNKGKARLMYWAVRLGGWKAFNG